MQSLLSFMRMRKTFSVATVLFTISLVVLFQNCGGFGSSVHNSNSSNLPPLANGDSPLAPVCKEGEQQSGYAIQSVVYPMTCGAYITKTCQGGKWSRPETLYPNCRQQCLHPDNNQAVDPGTTYVSFSINQGVTQAACDAGRVTSTCNQSSGTFIPAPAANRTCLVQGQVCAYTTGTGRSTPTGNMVGSTVTGYALQSATYPTLCGAQVSRSCQASGQWTGTTPLYTSCIQRCVHPDTNQPMDANAPYVYYTRQTGSQTECNAARVTSTCQSSSGVLSPNVSATRYQSCAVISDGEARFRAAKAVISANCIQCHSTAGGQTNFDLMAEQDFVNAGLITPASIANSKIIYRLKNYPDTSSPARTMPQNGNLSNTDYLVLTNWISAMPAPPTNTNIYSCDANETPLGLDARKLSKIEYTNALTALLSRALGTTDAATIIQQASVATKVPNDTGTTFSTGDANYSAVHAQAYFEVADAIASRIALPANYSRFVSTYINYNRGTCTYTTADNLNQVCRDTLVRNFVLRAFGRPIENTTTNLNNELATYQREFTAASSTTAGVEAMVFKTLVSPQFLMHLQTDVVVSGNFYRLTSHAIARRLAFTFMQTLPDEGLIAIAASQDLFNEASFMEALNYVTLRMDASVRQFMYEWLKLEKLPSYSGQSHPKFTQITQGLTVDNNLRQAMVEEVLELATFVSRNNMTMRDLFTTNISFARNPSLMRIYGQTAAAPATVTLQNAVRFPASDRGGLLTRAGVLFQGGHTENPILRGVHVRRDVFCLTTSSPPPNLPADSLSPPVPDPNLTTRMRYHNKTSTGVCVSCHSQINPVGFAFSEYNSFGALQRTEPIYNASNQYVTDLPTNSQVSLQPSLNVSRDTNNAIEFSQLTPEVPAFKKCVTENFYTFTQGLSQKPANQTNSCSMQRIYRSLDEGTTLQDFFKSSVLDRNYRYRNIAK